MRMKNEKVLIVLILILSFTLNTLGINWGVPSAERNRLYFTGEKEMRESMAEVTRDKVERSRTQYREEMSGSRFNPVRTYHPDESQFLASLSNMNIKKLDLNPHYFYYGTLYFWFFGIALALAYALGFVKLTTDLAFFYSHPEELARFYIAGRAVSAVFAALTVLMVYLVAKKRYGVFKGLMAALAAALVPLSVINAHYVAVDVTEVFFIIFSFYFSLKLLDSDENRLYVLAGALAGLAGSAKYPGLLVIAAVPVAVFLKSRRGLRDLLACWFRKKVLLSYLCGAAAFLITFPFIVTSHGEVMGFVRNVTGAWHPVSGTIFYSKALYNGLGLPLLLLSLAGLFLALRGKEKGDLLILFWVKFSFMLFASTGLIYDRYILAIVPFMAVLAVKGLEAFKNASLRNAALIFTLMLTFLYSFAYDRVFMSRNTRTAAGEWIAANIPAGSSIGLRRDPWQYEIPPLNRKKYVLCITGKQAAEMAGAVDAQRPGYFILGEAEFPPGGFQACTDLLSGKGYGLLREFGNPPRVFGIPFNHKDPSDNYRYMYPKIRVFKRASGQAR